MRMVDCRRRGAAVLERQGLLRGALRKENVGFVIEASRETHCFLLFCLTGTRVARVHGAFPCGEYGVTLPSSSSGSYVHTSRFRKYRNSGPRSVPGISR